MPIWLKGNEVLRMEFCTTSFASWKDMQIKSQEYTSFILSSLEFPLVFSLTLREWTHHSIGVFFLIHPQDPKDNNNSREWVLTPPNIGVNHPYRQPASERQPIVHSVHHSG
jgi:hypothetical protein